MEKAFLTPLFLIAGLFMAAQTAEERPEEAAYAAADAAVVFDSTKVYVEESGLSYVEQHKLLRVNTLAGASQYATVKMDYDPQSAYAEIREVKIRHADGTAEIVGNPVADYPAPARMIYWGARQKMVALDRLSPGDAIETRTFRKGFTYALLHGGGDSGDDDPDAMYIPPMRGHFYDIVPFWSDIPVMEKVYSVNLLTGKNLQYAVYNGAIDVTREETAGARTVYTFTKKDILPLEVPSHTLSNNDIQTKLLLSTAEDWKAKSRWFYGVNEDYGSFVPTDAARQKVHDLVKNARTELDSISILTHWVADNMRYSGLSMGKGEGFTLHNCEMNFTDRCGVCKDKAGMLIAMLRAAGFEAYAAMTMAGERIERIPADQFNHCVTVVKRRNGDYQLLDPTWVPGVRELWSSAEQQQNYLMGLPDGTDLKTTPISAPENHPVIMTAKTKLNRKGSLKATVTVTAEGQSDNTVRAVFYGRPQEWRQNIERQLLAYYPTAELKSVKYTDEFSYLDHPVSITYKFTVPDYAVIDDSTLIAKAFLANGFFRFAMGHLYYDTALETREYPFQDRCSRIVVLDEKMKVPHGFNKQVQIPQSEDFQKEYIGAHGGYKVKGRAIRFRETVSLGKRLYEASDWPDYRAAVLHQRRYQTTPLILTK